MTWKNAFSCNDWEHADECNPQQKSLRGRINILLKNKCPLIQNGQEVLFETSLYSSRSSSSQSSKPSGNSPYRFIISISCIMDDSSSSSSFPQNDRKGFSRPRRAKGRHRVHLHSSRTDHANGLESAQENHLRPCRSNPLNTTQTHRSPVFDNKRIG